MKESIKLGLNCWLTFIGAIVGFIGWTLETIGNYTKRIGIGVIEFSTTLDVEP